MFGLMFFLVKIKQEKQDHIYTQESENLHRKLSLKHYESEFRVVLIWLPEKMQSITSNKLLKLLEEPQKKPFFCWFQKTQI